MLHRFLVVCAGYRACSGLYCNPVNPTFPDPEPSIKDLIGRQWGSRLIRAWNESWFRLPEQVGAKIARLIGAPADEVIVADSTSVNLFKLVVAALRTGTGRTKLVTDDLNFPSDLYVFQSALSLLGPEYGLDVVRSPDGMTVPIQLLEEAIDARTALVALSHTAFKSGFIHDMKAVTGLAHQRGALMLWDLSHSGRRRGRC